MEIKDLIKKEELDSITEKELYDIPILMGMLIGGFLPLLVFFIISKKIDNLFLLTLIVFLGPIISIVSSILSGIIFNNLVYSRDSQKNIKL
jgi:VIT1/CCC1 family predicted Fe2+/Mn2+ transporter